MPSAFRRQTPISSLKNTVEQESLESNFFYTPPDGILYNGKQKIARITCTDHTVPDWMKRRAFGCKICLNRIGTGETQEICFGFGSPVTQQAHIRNGTGICART
ncbi:MAG: hypothetical protein ACLT1J_02820 [Mediterraneibacter gnavus]